MHRPGWEFVFSPAWGGYTVKINGKTVLDEKGLPAIYGPPVQLTDERSFDRWRAQVFESVERMAKGSL